MRVGIRLFFCARRVASCELRVASKEERKGRTGGKGRVCRKEVGMCFYCWCV